MSTLLVYHSNMVDSNSVDKFNPIFKWKNARIFSYKKKYCHVIRTSDIICVNKLHRQYHDLKLGDKTPKVKSGQLTKRTISKFSVIMSL